MQYGLDTLKWSTDYLLECNLEQTFGNDFAFVAQVGAHPSVHAELSVLLNLLSCLVGQDICPQCSSTWHSIFLRGFHISMNRAEGAMRSQCCRLRILADVPWTHAEDKLISHLPEHERSEAHY